MLFRFHFCTALVFSCMIVPLNLNVCAPFFYSPIFYYTLPSPRSGLISVYSQHVGMNQLSNMTCTNTVVLPPSLPTPSLGGCREEGRGEHRNLGGGLGGEDESYF